MTPARTICLGFLAVISVGTLLLCLPIAHAHGGWGNPLVALFTATSAVCVTGLSVVDVSSYYSFWGQLFIIALVQVGGLGYMTSTTVLLLLVGRRFSLRDRITLQQSLDLPAIAGGPQLVRSIIATTLLFELTGTFALLPTFVHDFGRRQGIWLAIFHSISAFNNAGFSLFPDSLVRYHSSLSVNSVVAILIIFGGIGYQVIMEMYLWLRDRLLRSRTFYVPSLHFRVVTTTTLTLLIAGFFALLFTELRNDATLGSMPLATAILGVFFQSVTTRTAGFNTIDIGQMTIASLFVMIVLMFIGASPGGTGGGIKTTTARVLFSCTEAALRSREEVVCYQREIPMQLIIKAVGIVVGSVTVVILATTFIAFSNPDLDFVQIFFEVVSGFATVGLSTGITAKLSIFGQIVLIAIMYIGRVGVLMLMSAFRTEPKPSAVNYPEANLFVG
ncbi:TrkH family potassium uptake protein [Trichothermofontia sp.]